MTSSEFHENVVDSAIALLYMTNWARALDYRPASLLNHTWSLSVEEQFYLIFPIVFLFLLKKGFKATTVVILFFVISLISLISWMIRVFSIEIDSIVLNGLYMRLDTRLDSLMIGCGLAVILFMLKNTNTNLINKTSNIWIFIPVIYLGYVVCQMLWLDVEMFKLHFYLVAISSAFLIYGVLVNENSFICKLLKTRFLVGIGKLSYSLYLWHFPIFAILRQEYNPYIVILIGGGVSLVFALLSYNCIEKKFYSRRE